MFNRALEEQAQYAVFERISRYAVVIDVSEGIVAELGTGTLITFSNRYFVLTCKHVVPPKYSNEELRFLFRPSGSSVSSTKDQIKNTPLHELERMIPAKSYPKKVEIIKRIYSEHRDDLVLLELDPSSSEVKNNEFYDFSKLGIKKPTETELLYLYGFPAELTRDVGFNRYGTLPYSLSSVLTHKELDLDLFAPEREFLIEYVLNDADSVKPYGLSGCGVWKRIPAGEGIWTSDVYLTGVQKSVLLKRDVLVATAGHVIEELMSKI